MRVLKIVLLSFTLFLLSIAIFLRARYGGGEYYPDLSTAPVLSENQLEAVFEYNEPLGNVAVSFENRMFFTVHPESRPSGNKLLEVVNGEAIPFPSEEFQTTFNTALGVMIDKSNRLWTIDHGNHGVEEVRLLAFDLTTDEVIYDYIFPSEIAGIGSFFNDLQVDQFGIVYIADLSFFGKSPAIVVHDSNTGESRRLLENHPSVSPQHWIIKVDDHEMTFIGGLVAFKPGVDGIVLSPNEDFIYYGTMTHNGLYRINTTTLLNKRLSAYDVSTSVEYIGNKPLNDGLSIDDWGNVYITDVEHHSIMRMDASGGLKTMIQSDRIRWADGLSYGGDGYLYFTDSALPQVILKSKSSMDKAAPYHIFRFHPGISGVAGR